jgi:hypothetical protein
VPVLYVTRYIWAIHLSLLVLAGYVGADLVRAIGTSLPQTTHKQAGRATSAPVPFLEKHPADFYAVISERYLFGASGKEAGTEGTPNPAQKLHQFLSSGLPRSGMVFSS